MAERRVNAQEFVSAGLINDADVTVTRARWEVFDYQGKSAKESCALHLTLKDSSGDEHENYWSAGDADVFGPSKDGKYLVAKGDRTSLGKGSNYQVLVDSLEQNGMPDGAIAEDISLLEGLKGHVMRVPAPQRNIEGQKKRDDGRVAEVLVFSKVDYFPWEDKKGSKKRTAAGGSKSKAQDSNGDSDGANEATIKAIKKVLIDNPDGMDMQDLKLEIYNLIEGGKEAKREAMALAGDADFLKEAGLSVDGETVSLGD